MAMTKPPSPKADQLRRQREAKAEAEEKRRAEVAKKPKRLAKKSS